APADARSFPLLGQRADQLELDAAVLGPRRVELAAGEVLRGLGRDRIAVALGGQAFLVDAPGDEVRLYRLGARLRQRGVVGELAARLDRLVVGVALDLELELAELLEHGDRLVERRERARLQRGVADLEVDALDHAGELLELLRDL